MDIRRVKLAIKEGNPDTLEQYRRTIEQEMKDSLNRGRYTEFTLLNQQLKDVRIALIRSNSVFMRQRRKPSGISLALFDSPEKSMNMVNRGLIAFNFLIGGLMVVTGNFFGLIPIMVGMGLLGSVWVTEDWKLDFPYRITYDKGNIKIEKKA
jgi:hypothetical protein